MKIENLNYESIDIIKKFSDKLSVLFEYFNIKWVNVGVPQSKDIFNMFMSLIDDILKDDEIKYAESGMLFAEYEDDGIVIGFKQTIEDYISLK